MLNYELGLIACDIWMFSVIKNTKKEWVMVKLISCFRLVLCAKELFSIFKPEEQDWIKMGASKKE